jgi:CBS domain-containing protein
MRVTTKATDYMTCHVDTIRQDETLQTAINLMIERSLGCLPVVDHSSQLVGMLTEGDILRRAAQRVALIGSVLVEKL